jgi:hypothetical protein
MEWSEFMQYMIDQVGNSDIPTAESGSSEVNVL